MFLILIVLSKVEIPYPAYGSSGGKSQFHFIDARQGIDPDRDTAVLDRTDADIIFSRSGKCIFTGRPAKYRAIFAKSY